MFEFVVALAIVCAIIIGVKYGFHKEGGAGVIAFLLIFGIAFVVIGVIILIFAFIVG